MSLLPSLVAMVIVLLMVSSATRLVQDATLAASQWGERQLARQRAASLLRRVSPRLVIDGDASEHTAIRLETLPTAEIAEIGDLPLVMHRVTVTAQGRHASVTLPADYAVDGCESEHDAPCQPRIRLIAWRELVGDE